MREDPATRLAQANLAYAAQNADQGSLLSKPLANGGLNASNATTAAMQFAAQLNASNGQVTPLLFGNDASAGGDAGGSVAVRTARTGVLVVDYAGKAGDVGVAFSKDQYMPKNAVKYNGAAEGTRQVNRPKGDTRFADYAANAFTRDRFARQESLIPNAVDRMLNAKAAYSPKMQYGNATLVDADKNPSVSWAEYQRIQSWKNSGEYALSSNLAQAQIITAVTIAGLEVPGLIGRVAPILNDWRAIVGINSALDVAGQYKDTDGFTTGSYRLDKTVVSSSLALIGGRALNYLPGSSGYVTQYTASALVGGATSALNTGYNNFITSKNESLTESFGSGVLFGVIGKKSGSVLESSMVTGAYTSSYAKTIGGRFETATTGVIDVILSKPDNSNFVPYVDYLNKNKAK